MWYADITFVRKRRGLLYLLAIMEWRSRSSIRALLSWCLSNILDADFCVAVLEEAINRHALLQIFNTDQGSQFTSLECTPALKDAGAAISIDGKSQWVGNIFIERLWRPVKRECVYLRELETAMFNTINHSR